MANPTSRHPKLALVVDDEVELLDVLKAILVEEADFGRSRRHRRGHLHIHGEHARQGWRQAEILDVCRIIRAGKIHDRHLGCGHSA